VNKLPGFSPHQVGFFPFRSVRICRIVELPAITSSLNANENFGAGEGIRTLDPNLGKVVLYP
jgi:hypothetical protein